MCHTKMISQHNDAFQFEVHGFVRDLAEQSWAFEGSVMNDAVLGPKELKCICIVFSLSE